MSRSKLFLVWFAILALILSVVVVACGDDDDDADSNSGDDDNDAVDDDDDSGNDDDDNNDDDSGESLYVGTAHVYGPGYLNIEQIDVAEGEMGAPKSATVYAPVEPGRYAVLQFQHGFLLSNKFYSDMLNQVASHGFIIVAPQMYPAGGLPLGKPSSEEEAAAGVEIMEWLSDHLSDVAGVEAAMDHFGFAGHSRGGKVTWTILKQDHSGVKAVAGVDPVDSEMPLFGEERVVTGPFDFPFPSLVIGTGLGPEPLIPLLFPPCAPEGDNHVQFYDASASPAYHVIALEYGHLDMLNDSTPGCGAACISCTEGPVRETMRVLTGGLLTAFFRATLQEDETAYDILMDGAAAPTAVEMEQK